MVAWIVSLLLKALVVLGVSKTGPGVRVQGYGAAIAVAIVYALLSMLLKGLLVMISLPLLILSLGLFMIVINAVLLWMTNKVLSSFEVRGKGALLLATVAITGGGMLVDYLVPKFF